MGGADTVVSILTPSVTVAVTLRGYDGEVPTGRGEPMKGLRRAFVVASATVALGAMSAGPALAHFCYNASRPAHASQKAAGSEAWASIPELLAMEGMCEDGIVHFLANSASVGLDPDTVILLSSTMANGILRNPQAEDLQRLSTDGRGIDHLVGVDWAALEALIVASFGHCSS